MTEMNELWCWLHEDNEGKWKLFEMKKYLFVSVEKIFNFTWPVHVRNCLSVVYFHNYFYIVDSLLFQTHGIFCALPVCHILLPVFNWEQKPYFTIWIRKYIFQMKRKEKAISRKWTYKLRHATGKLYNLFYLICLPSSHCFVIAPWHRYVQNAC